MALPLVSIPGPARDAGHAHGRLTRELFEPAFCEQYVQSLCAINRVERRDMTSQAERWLSQLPLHHQEEIDGMAAGARVPLIRVTELLYADIARATDTSDQPFDPARPSERPPEPVPNGPMCSAMITPPARTNSPWIARNCDWLKAILVRGTSAVHHALPNRIPVLAVGINGDIDIDTGMNAEGLWLHLHTLYAPGDPKGDRTRISWLFWAREALELCATLDELERFIESTERDRGVIAIAADGKTGETALFECSKSDHRRIDGNGDILLATNHPQHKHPDAERVGRSRPGSTIARYGGLRDLVDRQPPERLPEDLIGVLGHESVEMRTPTHLRTIYSAVADPATRRIWFAAGTADGKPAASTGSWESVPMPF